MKLGLCAGRSTREFGHLGAKHEANAGLLRTQSGSSGPQHRRIRRTEPLGCRRGRIASWRFTSSALPDALSARDPSSSDSDGTISTAPESPSPGSDTADPEREPEAALILLACGIGLTTGASIVVFNELIHAIRDAIWHEETLLASTMTLRNISETELWPKVVFPPVVGGAVVGALGLLMGGYNNPKKKSKKPKQQGLQLGGGIQSSVRTSTSSGTTATRSLPRGGSSSGVGTTNGSGSSSSSRLPVEGTAALSGTVSTWGAPVAGTQSSSSSSEAGSAGGFSVEGLRSATRPLARAVAATVTLGTGASLGPEGPSVDIGRSVAKALGSRLKSKEEHITRLLAAGSAAGVAAGFNAPIAGVFFAVETVQQRLKPPQKTGPPNGLAVAMVLLAAVLAAVVAAAGLGSSPAFRVPAYRLESLFELPLYLVFGALCGTISASFSYSTRVASQAFDEVRQYNKVEGAVLPVVGGLTTGVLALGYPEILYQGFDNVNAILSSAGDYAPGLLVQIVVIKIIATAICRGSGLQGGIYAPSIFIGAALGQAFGQVAHLIGDPAGLPLSEPQAYALVGVAAMLASNCQVPLTSILLLFELTRDYLIIVPTLAAVGISFWVSSLAAPSVAAAPLPSAEGAPAAAAAAAAALLRRRKPGGESDAGLETDTEGDDSPDGLPSDPSAARQRVAAVMQQLEGVLHLKGKGGEEGAAGRRLALPPRKDG